MAESAIVEPPLTAAELLAKAQELFTSFNAAAVSVDTHTEETLRAWRLPHESDATFLRQVFYGCVRYKKLLGAMLAAFYSRT